MALHRRMVRSNTRIARVVARRCRPVMLPESEFAARGLH
jgi:hypothetical protein